MQNTTTRYPSEEIFALPPPSIEVRPSPPATIETNLGFVLTLANLMVTAIIVVAMILDGTQAKNAIIAGSLYFAVTMTGFALVVTGALGSMVAALAHEHTERQRIDAYEALGLESFAWRMAVEETRQIELLGRTPPTEGVQRTSPLNYVAPFADGEQAQHEGVRFAMGLYSTMGRPDPKHVHPDGRLRGRMLGSKRGSGSREAGRWLLRAGIIQRVRGGYALDISRFPTRDSLRHLL
jgi:hypothetical protein